MSLNKDWPWLARTEVNPKIKRTEPRIVRSTRKGLSKVYRRGQITYDMMGRNTRDVRPPPLTTKLEFFVF